VENVLDEHENFFEKVQSSSPFNAKRVIVNWLNRSMLLSAARESLYNFWPIWFDSLSFLLLHIWSWGPLIDSGILRRIPAIFKRRLSSE
jgi:hypothetical protein